MANKKNKQMQSIGSLLDKYNYQESKKYISREFQDYGLRLAKELDDKEHKSLYIKLAKEESRGLLEEAKNFVKDASNVRSKGKLFMWKLKKIKEEKDNESS
jgi:hypothetical protein